MRTYRDLKKLNPPRELSGQAQKCPGCYAIHYYGEERGELNPWCGSTAESLADEDHASATAVMQSTGDDVAKIEVVVFLLISNDECYELDRATIE